MLGETVLSATLAIKAAFGEEHPPDELWLVVVGGVLVTFGGWWLYFARENAEILSGNSTGFWWGFGHYVIFASAAAIGAGLAARIAFYDHHTEGVSDVVSSAFVTGPAAAFLAALWIVNIRLHDASARTAVPFGTAVVALVVLTFVPWSELWAGLVVAALLVVELRLTADPHEPADVQG